MSQWSLCNTAIAVTVLLPTFIKKGSPCSIKSLQAPGMAAFLIQLASLSREDPPVWSNWQAATQDLGMGRAIASRVEQVRGSFTKGALNPSEKPCQLSWASILGDEPWQKPGENPRFRFGVIFWWNRTSSKNMSSKVLSPSISTMIMIINNSISFSIPAWGLRLWNLFVYPITIVAVHRRLPASDNLKVDSIDTIWHNEYFQLKSAQAGTIHNRDPVWFEGGEFEIHRFPKLSLLLFGALRIGGHSFH